MGAAAREGTMSRDEALTAVYNAGRALQQGCPLTGVFEGAPVRPLLVALYAAVEAVDAGTESRERPPGLCADSGCWEYRWMGGRYCFAHRGQEALRRRAVGEEGPDA